MGKVYVFLLIAVSCVVSTWASSVLPEAERSDHAKGANVPMTLLLRQLILDKYGSEGCDSLTDEQKAQLRKDAREARKKARREFAKHFDKDGDGKYSPEEFRKLRERSKAPFPRNGLPSHRGRYGQDDSSQSAMIDVRTSGKKQFRVAPGLMLLTRNLLLEKYDANKNGFLDPTEREMVRKDAQALYRELWQSLLDTYDVDQDGQLSPVEREQALASSHEDAPMELDGSNEDVDLIDLFIQANMSDVLLKEDVSTTDEE